MIDPELQQALDALSGKIDATYQAAEKTRKYIWWTMIITIAVIVIPMLLLPFAFSSLMSYYSTAVSL